LEPEYVVIFDYAHWIRNIIMVHKLQHALVPQWKILEHCSKWQFSSVQNFELLKQNRGWIRIQEVKIYKKNLYTQNAPTSIKFSHCVMNRVLDHLTEKSFHWIFLTERPFDRNIIWPNTVLPNAISPKVHSTESPFSRTPFNRTPFNRTPLNRKFILPKSHMTDFFFFRKWSFDRIKLYSGRIQIQKLEKLFRF
jgi:hypothetical protein